MQNRITTQRSRFATVTYSRVISIRKVHMYQGLFTTDIISRRLKPSYIVWENPMQRLQYWSHPQRYLETRFRWCSKLCANNIEHIPKNMHCFEGGLLQSLYYLNCAKHVYIGASSLQNVYKNPFNGQSIISIINQTHDWAPWKNTDMQRYGMLQG